MLLKRHLHFVLVFCLSLCFSPFEQDTRWCLNLYEWDYGINMTVSPEWHCSLSFPFVFLIYSPSRSCYVTQTLSARCESPRVLMSKIHFKGGFVKWLILNVNRRRSAEVENDIMEEVWCLFDQHCTMWSEQECVLRSVCLIDGDAQQLIVSWEMRGWEDSLMDDFQIISFY